MSNDRDSEPLLQSRVSYPLLLRLTEDIIDQEDGVEAFFEALDGDAAAAV